MNNDEGIGEAMMHAAHPDAAMLVAYHDGELRGADRDAVAAHVVACASCQQPLADLSRLDAALRDLPSVEPSPRVRAAVYARVEGDATSALHLLLNPWRSMARARWWALAAVAALAAVIGGYDVVSQATQPVAVGRPLAATPSAASRPHAAGQQLRPTRMPAPMAAMSPNTVQGSGSDQGSTNLSATTAQPSIHGPLLPPTTGRSAPTGPGIHRFTAVPRTNSRSFLPAQSTPVQPTQSVSRKAVQAGNTADVQSTPVQPAQSARVQRRPTAVVTTRLVVRAGEVAMRVPAADARRTVDAVSGLAARRGGSISSARDDGARRVGGTGVVTLTVRAPAASFEAIMSGLRTLAGAGLVGAGSTSRDITGGYHDLQARLEVFQATRGRLLAHLNGARSIHDATAVRARLTAVDRQIAAVRRQILADDSAVMVSTIEVSIAPVPPSRTQGRTVASP